MKFNTQREFTESLYAELERRSENDPARLAEVKRDFALERCMARLEPSEVILKGGFAVRTMVDCSPLTSDLDILIDKPHWRELNARAANHACSDYIIDAIGKHDDDSFAFNPTGSALLVDSMGEALSGKLYVQVSVGGMSFAAIDLNFGVKPDLVPTEMHTGRDLLNFAGVSNPKIATVSREYLIADKINLFLQYGCSRPRDLAHAALLLKDGAYDLALLSDWTRKFADKRGNQIMLVRGLLPIEDEPIIEVEHICRKYRLKLTGKECYELVREFLRQMNDK